MSDKDDIIAQLEAKHDEFRGMIADLPGEAYDEGGLADWNLSQLLAHMAGWYREMAGAFERVGRGERPAPEGVDYSNFDEWNEGFAASAKSGTAALDDWEEAYRTYLGAAKGLDENLYGTDPEKGRPRIGDRLLGPAGLLHFEEHGEQVKAWLASR